MSRLLQALYRGDRATVEELLAVDPSLDVFEAAAVGRRDRLSELLDEDPARANAFGDDGFHPLGLACFFGNVDAARLLLERGADVNALSRNEHVQTAAIHAAAAAEGKDESVRYELVQLALEHGPIRTSGRAAASPRSTRHARTATNASSSCCSITAPSPSGPLPRRPADLRRAGAEHR